MDFQEKIEELKEIIRERLLPIMGKKAILVDAPYYNNIGDVLIWQGIVDFLKDNGIKLVATSSGDTFTFPEINQDTTILMMGGGNFGDLWRWAQDMRLKVIERYPNNRLIMFPQSVWYEDESLIDKDSEIMARHQNLYLCARDKWSYDFFKKFFSSNHIILVPDMAFYINESVLKAFRNKRSEKKLFFRRLDKEITATTPKSIGEEYDIRDWPTIEKEYPIFKRIKQGINLAHRFRNFNALHKFTLKTVDKIANSNIRKGMVREGGDFLSNYSHITSTRLHAMILGVLLHKSVDYMDNSTRKLSAFANSWLNNLPQLKPYERN